MRAYLHLHIEANTQLASPMQYPHVNLSKTLSYEISVSTIVS